MTCKSIFQFLTIIGLMAGTICAQNHITITAPAASDSFYVGDTIHLRFTSDATVGGSSFGISFDGGFLFYTIGDGKKSDADWEDFTWCIPDTFIGVNPMLQWDTLTTVSNVVMLQINDQYNPSGARAYSSPAFRILPRKVDAVEKRSRHPQPTITLSPNPARSLCRLSGDADKIILYTLSGRLLKQEIIRHQDSFEINTSSLPNGIYLLKILTNQGVLSKRVMIEK